MFFYVDLNDIICLFGLVCVCNSEEYLLPNTARKDNSDA